MGLGGCPVLVDLLQQDGQRLGLLTSGRGETLRSIGQPHRGTKALAASPSRSMREGLRPGRCSSRAAILTRLLRCRQGWWPNRPLPAREDPDAPSRLLGAVDDVAYNGQLGAISRPPPPRGLARRAGAADCCVSAQLLRRGRWAGHEALPTSGGRSQYERENSRRWRATPFWASRLSAASRRVDEDALRGFLQARGGAGHGVADTALYARPAGRSRRHAGRGGDSAMQDEAAACFDRGGRPAARLRPERTTPEGTPVPAAAGRASGSSSRRSAVRPGPRKPCGPPRAARRDARDVGR